MNDVYINMLNNVSQELRRWGDPTSHKRRHISSQAHSTVSKPKILAKVKNISNINISYVLGLWAQGCLHVMQGYAATP